MKAFLTTLCVTNFTLTTWVRCLSTTEWVMSLPLEVQIPGCSQCAPLSGWLFQEHTPPSEEPLHRTPARTNAEQPPPARKHSGMKSPSLPLLQTQIISMKHAREIHPNDKRSLQANKMLRGGDMRGCMTCLTSHHVMCSSLPRVHVVHCDALIGGKKVTWHSLFCTLDLFNRERGVSMDQYFRLNPETHSFHFFMLVTPKQLPSFPY